MHFKVFVACAPFEDYEDLLAEYDCDSRKERVLNRTKERVIQQGREYAEHLREKLKSNPDMELDSYRGRYLSAKSDEDFYNLEKDDDYYEYDENGDEYVFENPNAKWDWYELGGRFSADFLLEDGTRADFAEKRRIVWELTEEEKTHCFNFWDKYVENCDSMSEEDKERYWSLYEPEYLKEKYGDRETYLEVCRTSAPFAFLSSETGWIESGSLGTLDLDESDKTQEWEQRFKELVGKVPDDYVIYCVDCHI